jgi:hypothetical protein
MTHRSNNREASDSRSPKLALCPLDQAAVEPLAQSINPAQLYQSRLASIAAMMSLLEPLQDELYRMDSIARALDHPASPQLIHEIEKTRKSANSLYIMLGDTFKWV